MVQSIADIKLLHKGKVRDVYQAGEKHLLIVSTDRISAFDFVLPTEIPGKGRILNQLSAFWFGRTGHIIKNHLVSSDIKEIQALAQGVKPPLGGWESFSGRSMLAHKAARVDFECIVRGYITGSGWKEYLKNGAVCGIKLPAGLKEAQKLPEPIFTPTSKADQGHDENVTFEEMASSTGSELAAKIKDRSLELYKFAAAYALERGIILADTKFEFGLHNGELMLIDEAFTPDSSRFWDAASYRPGTSPESYDKQFVRNWLEKSGWDKRSTPPALPADVVERTSAKYSEALIKLTGAGLQ